MPTYEYRCLMCRKVHAEVRRIKDRNKPFDCGCLEYRRTICERILTAPHTTRWNSEEWFPNLDAYEDRGKQFESREAYDKYLKDEKIVEVGTPRCGGGGPSTRKTYRYGKKAHPPPPPRGSW